MNGFEYRLKQPLLVAGLFILAWLSACQLGSETGNTATSQPATLVVTDARVWTGDPAQPWAEAVAVTGERISAVGDNDEIARLVGPDTVQINASGQMLTPGFIDTHVHFVDGGSGLASVQLRDAKTRAEFVRRIKDFATSIEPGEWILYGTWDHENWGGELPTRDWIDPVTPDNPVWIHRLDGHMALANSLALEASGIDADSPDIDGGTIVRDASGRPTGVLKDNAMFPVTAVVPAASNELLDNQVRAAMREVASHGVTTVHDMADFKSLASYERLHANQELITRIYSVVPLSEWEALRDRVAKQGRGDAMLRIGGLKGFMDGSLGSHTAAFFEGFSDAPEDRGFLINELDDMHAWIAGADAAGLHVIVHAIGDKAISDLLNIYYDVAEDQGARDRRFRIEHAQHIRPADIDRFAAQDIIASMQPYHAIDDGRWAEKVIGPERIKTTYAFRSLLDSGARVAFGSDWSVAPAEPLLGIYAAVTRRTLDDANPDGWVPEEKISVAEALRAYTSAGAYASFEEHEKGMLREGLLADMVLLDRDLTAIAPESIRDTRVLRTILGGRIVYSADDPAAK